MLACLRERKAEIKTKTETETEKEIEIYGQTICKKLSIRAGVIVMWGGPLPCMQPSSNPVLHMIYESTESNLF